MNAIRYKEVDEVTCITSHTLFIVKCQMYMKTLVVGASQRCTLSTASLEVGFCKIERINYVRPINDYN